MLSTEDLYYISPQGKPLIKSVSLSYPSGQVHAIVGPNGSGKTTLLKLLNSILPPSSGKVLWNGESLLAFSRKERSKLLSFVPQAPLITFDFTVEEIVAMGLYPMRQAESKKVEDALEFVDINHLKKREITTLSSGERQRVYIARSLATDSPVLLLDEPTANLDLKHQLAIWELLKLLKCRGKLIIVASHDFNAVRLYSDTVTLMQEGVAVNHGLYSNVLTEHALSETFKVTRAQFESIS